MMITDTFVRSLVTFHCCLIQRQIALLVFIYKVQQILQVLWESGETWVFNTFLQNQGAMKNDKRIWDSVTCI